MGGPVQACLLRDAAVMWGQFQRDRPEEVLYSKALRPWSRVVVNATEEIYYQYVDSAYYVPSDITGMHHKGPSGDS